MYRAPVAEIAFALKEVADMGSAMERGAFGDLSADLVDAILEEAGKFATDEVAPLSKIGDEHGTPLKDAVVSMPPGWNELYKNWSQGGWNALTGPEEFGGQGLPMILAVATFEMWNSGSLAFGIGPTLTIGAIEALEAHATDELKQTYLEKLVSGEWMGTMNLTEPQAGSDLNAVKSKAEPNGDGTYKVFGQKIYITYGEHDLTDNIIHLVLARLPDAPAGYRGISLFLVPKFLLNEEGTPDKRNDVFCNGVEHKLGIHGSPTCTMIFGDGFDGNEPGAIGWLVGEENRGLACMFTMMNNARLMVGIQGVAVAEAAYQKALAYANERKQGNAPGSDPNSGMSEIVDHPDVQRNLLTMKALTNAARHIAYANAYAIDMTNAGADSGADASDKKRWNERANLITPIAKAFSTDVGVEVASIGVQVHGGMGYVEETGAAQYLRDARIAPIYEGTNGIQAIDLVTRKLPLSGGKAVNRYIDELAQVIEAIRKSNRPGFGDTAECLKSAFADLRQTKDWMLEQLANENHSAALSGATPFLRLFGLVSGNAYLAKAALATESGEPKYAERTALARFMAENILGETSGLKRAIMLGSQSLLDAGAALKAQ